LPPEVTVRHVLSDYMGAVKAMTYLYWFTIWLSIHLHAKDMLRLYYLYENPAWWYFCQRLVKNWRESTHV